VLKKYTKAADGSMSEVSLSTTPAVARAVTGTIDTALGGTPAALRFGDLRITTVASGQGVPDDDDGTVLIPYLIANVGQIPADNVVDHEDGSFTITCHPGANNIVFSSADAQLTFAEGRAGTDQVSTLSDGSDVVTADEAAISVRTTHTSLAVVSGGIVTLAAPPAEMLGRVKVVEMTVDDGDVTMELAHVEGGSEDFLATFDAVGEALVLVAGIDSWIVLKELGVTLAGE
jgi:hypothetical protein